MPELTITEDQMLQAVRDVFQGKHKKQSLRRVLYAIYVRQDIEEGRRQADLGQKIPHEQVMEEMWSQINTGLSGRQKRNGNSRKSLHKF
jgi:predicted transcriptional regulator